jgi:hypothetical protein
MQTIDCPSCMARVLPKSDGKCPSCGADTNAPPSDFVSHELVEDVRPRDLCTGCATPTARRVEVAKVAGTSQKTSLVRGGWTGIAGAILIGSTSLRTSTGSYRFTMLPIYFLLGGIALLLRGLAMDPKRVTIRLPRCERCTAAEPTHIDFERTRMTFTVRREFRSAAIDLQTVRQRGGA